MSKEIVSVARESVKKGLVLEQDWNNVSQIFSSLLEATDPAENVHRAITAAEETYKNRKDFMAGWIDEERFLNKICYPQKSVLWARDKEPYLFIIEDDPEHEAQLGNDMGLQQASYAEYVVVEFARKEKTCRIDFGNITERLSTVISIEEEASEEMATHFRRNPQNYAPYKIEQDGLRLQLSLGGLGEQRLLEDPVVLKADAKEQAYPPSLWIEVAQWGWVPNMRGGLDFGYAPVTTQEGKQAMETLSQNLTQAFSENL